MASATGTTTNSYITPVDLNMGKGRLKATIYLKNTGSSSNDLSYQLLGYADYDGEIESTLESGTLSDGDIASLYITVKKLARVKLQVKSAVADSATDYRVEWITSV